jgi:Flp pilus assembly protein TadG
MLRSLRRALAAARRLRLDARGGIGVSFAVSLPALLAIVGVASDYAMLSMIRTELQAAADGAAMAGAREMPLALAKTAQVTSAAQTFAAYRLTEDAAATPDQLAARKLVVDVSVDKASSSVNVAITEQWTPFFLHFVKATVTPVRVSSQARFVGRSNICVLGLAASGTAVYLDRGARLAANKCGVFSNSAAASALKADAGSTLTASLVCSVGGVSAAGSITPAPVTDCPPQDDPLASRAAPAFGGCDFNNVTITNVTRTLNPGVYCGGLRISGSSSVTLNPGIYVIKDGGLTIGGTAKVSGTGVGFYVTGMAVPISFTALTHISLSAPVSGPMAGLLFFEDRKLPVKLRHRFTSDDARKLIGTIYLPVGSLVVDARMPVADQSAYTAIVTQALELNMGPNLVLNSDYSATDVPVPDGIAGSSQVVLSN